MSATPPPNKPNNARLAWVLATVALAFFAGVVVKRWLFAG